MSYQSDLTGAFIDQQLTDKLITPIGGVAVKFINKTGATSVKGNVLELSATTERAVRLQADEYDAMGVVYESGIADGEEMWVVITGIAEILLEDGTAGTLDYWVRASDTDGRGDMLPVPPGGTIQEIDNHFKEIGHCLQTVSAGTDILCKIILHFN